MSPSLSMCLVLPHKGGVGPTAQHLLFLQQPIRRPCEELHLPEVLEGPGGSDSWPQLYLFTSKIPTPPLGKLCTVNLSESYLLIAQCSLLYVIFRNLNFSEGKMCKQGNNLLLSLIISDTQIPSKTQPSHLFLGVFCPADQQGGDQKRSRSPPLLPPPLPFLCFLPSAPSPGNVF